ncbi:MAG TPA: murein biosynthesis integral membrane protein MurJ [Thermoleophilaceae bacterium]|jgi:putative peptidoglycan lipid II flippase
MFATGGEPSEDERKPDAEPEPTRAGEDSEPEPTRAAADPEPEPGSGGRRLAVSTLFFSFATALSRVMGLVREVVAASMFGVKGPMSAFTIAFQVPNLVRALVADAALQGAFVPVFTELLEKGKRREAFKVASGLLTLIAMVLGALTLIFLIAAPPLIELVTPGFDDEPVLRDLTTGLSQLMFPIVLLLALAGVTVGMLNSFDRFGAAAVAPVFWNLAIIACLVGLTPVFHGDDDIYAYAIGVLAGTVIQLVLPLPWLRGTGGRFTFSLDWRNPHVIRVLKLMLPVTIALGLINFSLLINSFFGTLVSEEAPAAIDKAFRIYMLPQGIFSVAIATVVFPTLARFAARREFDDLRSTMANGVRLICLLLIPSAAFMAVLAEPITRVVYERGEFDPAATDLVAEAMFWWAFSLPAQGVSLLLSRTYFSLQRPWMTTALAGGNMVVNAIVALALYEPLGVGGIVIGTVVGTVGMALAQAWYLRPDLGGVEGAQTLRAVVRMLLAAGILAAVAYLTWRALDETIGRAIWSQAAAVAAAIVTGTAAYAAAVWLLRVEEAKQIVRLLAGRLGRS